MRPALFVGWLRYRFAPAIGCHALCLLGVTAVLLGLLLSPGAAWADCCVCTDSFLIPLPANNCVNPIACNFECSNSGHGDEACCNSTATASCAGFNGVCSTDPTATPTDTPTVTPTDTPVPAGGLCTQSSQCDTCSFCLNDVCTQCAGNAPAPTTSRSGLLIGLGILAAIAAVALWRRRELKHYLWSL